MSAGVQRVRVRGLVGAVLVASLVPAPAAGELYRCRDAQGSVRYTDSPHGCRGAATRHTTRRELQGSGAPSAPSAPPARRRFRPASPGVSPDEVAAANWRQKKQYALAELREIAVQLPRWKRLQLRCNRGADTWYTDAAGLKHGVSCDQIAAARSRTESEITRLRAYLDEGLEEECRRAGCLHGWVR